MNAIQSKSHRNLKAQHVDVVEKADLVKLFAEMLDAAPLADARSIRIELGMDIEKDGFVDHEHVVRRAVPVWKR